jgi:hypothetical protein
MESQLRGLDYTESFTHRLIAPMYDISKTQWSTISYTLTLLLFTISTSKIYNDPKWSQAWDSLLKTHENIKTNNEMGIFSKIAVYMKSIDILTK